VSTTEKLSDPPIACTLTPVDAVDRVVAWRDALASVAAREAIDDGIRLVLPPGTSLAAIAELVVAEQSCCMFFRFAITVDSRGAALEVRAPSAGSDLVQSLFGDPG
jgi:hypothetical protein